MELTRLGPDDPQLSDILTLIRHSFAYMDGIVDPPSSVHRLTPSALSVLAREAEVWSAGPPLSACAIFTPQDTALYIGKLCVADHARGCGLARRLIDHAANRAKALNLPILRLQSRIELTGNHAAFLAMGFVERERTAHPGYRSPTSITFTRKI